MFLRGSSRFVKPDPGHEEDQGLAPGAQDMNREPRRRCGLADEAGQLDAAHAGRSDLADRDAAPRELLGQEVGGVPDSAAGDQLAA